MSEKYEPVIGLESTYSAFNKIQNFFVIAVQPLVRIKTVRFALCVWVYQAFCLF